MFNQVPWQAQGPNPPPVPPHPPRLRAMTGIPPSHPQAFFPAHRPSTVHTSDLFFVAPTQNNFPPPPPPARPLPNFARPNTSTGLPSHHLNAHRALTCPPPIPPKPSEWQPAHHEIKPSNHADLPVRLPLPTNKETPSEEAELALAIELSRSESQKQLPANNQEDEEFARALEESLKIHATNLAPLPPSSEALSTELSSIASEPETPTQFSLGSPSSPQTPTLNSLRLTPASKEDFRTNGEIPPGFGAVSTTNTQSVGQCADDEALARRLAGGDDNSACANDEVFARRLAEEEANTPRTSNNHDVGVAQMRRNDLPAWSKRYQARASTVHVTGGEEDTNRVSMRNTETSTTLRNRSKSAMATLSARPPSIQDLPPPYEVPGSAGPTVTTPASDSGPPSASATSGRPLGSPGEISGPLNYLHRTTSSPTVTSPQPSVSGHSLTHLAARPIQSASSDLLEEEEDPYPEPSSSNGISNPYVSEELLKGISIGFEPPPMTPQTAIWSKPLPTVISLPHGRSLPLHIQATSWRHVLQLLARLPGSTIQPTIEAMAETKTEHRLRTVVQFVKPHLASTEWRTILWFTLEHSVPPTVTGGTRYTNDVNVLPWSYTLNPPPQLLRGGPDSQLTKTYTVPATASLSFPKLPITLPELTMYLHAALEVSRRHINDSSSGVRKLAKMLDMCYPNTNAEEGDDSGERRGVGGLFKKVMGRNNRRRGGNEDTYDLVTPFVADEWG